MITKKQIKTLVEARKLLDKADALEKRAVKLERSKRESDWLRADNVYDEANRLEDRANKAMRTTLNNIIRAALMDRP